MNVSYEGTAFLLGHSLCHTLGNDFRELRPKAAMWQGDMIIHHKHNSQVPHYLYPALLWLGICGKLQKLHKVNLKHQENSCLYAMHLKPHR